MAHQKYTCMSKFLQYCGDKDLINKPFVRLQWKRMLEDEKKNLKNGLKSNISGITSIDINENMFTICVYVQTKIFIHRQNGLHKSALSIQVLCNICM